MNGPIQPPLPPLQTLSLSSRLAETLALRPGQQINAEVVSVRPDQVTLRVGDQLLNARSERPLLPGQHYTFRVQFSQGQWQLVPQTAAAPQGSSNPLTTLLMPNAQPVATALTQLLQQLPLQALPTPLQPLLQQLRQQLLTPERLTGDKLENAIAHSGLFFESRTHRSGQPPQDLKATLLKLLAQAQQDDKSLIEPIRAMLRHISHHQARTLAEQHLVIPLLFAPESGILQGTLVIDPDDGTRQSRAQPRRWQAILELDFEEEGTLQLGIQLQKTTLTLKAWSAHPAWRDRLEAHLADLKTWMHKGGFEVATLQWQDQPLLRPATPKVSIQA